MHTYTILSKHTGIELASVRADSPADALLKMEAEIGASEVSVFDDTRGINGSAAPEWRHFDSFADALKVFVPEALAHFEITD